MNENYYRQIFSKNLRYYMKINNKSQADIIRDLGVNKSAVSTWCNGMRLPRMDKVDLLANYFRINRSDLIEEKISAPGFSHRAVSINVYGHIAAKTPLELTEDIIDTEEIPEGMAKSGEFFGLQIHGDSMEPKFSDGDIVIVRRQDDAKSDEIIIAAVSGADAACKRLRKYRDGIALISSNPVYDPMYFSSKEVLEKPVRILGKVVELRAKF